MNDSLLAQELIAQICQRVAAGKAATREVRSWLLKAGIGEVEFRLLWLLRDGCHQQIPQNQLAALLVVSTGQVSATVERLHAQELIHPCVPAGDRRRQCWRVTTRGHRLLANVIERVAALQKVQPQEAA